MGRFDRYADSPSMAHLKPARVQGARTGLPLLTAYEEGQRLTPTEFATLENAVLSWGERKLGREVSALFDFPTLRRMYGQELDGARQRREEKSSQQERTEEGRKRKRAEKRLAALRYEFRGVPTVLARLSLELARAINDAGDAERRESQYLSGLSTRQVKSAVKRANKERYDARKGKERERKKVEKEIQDLTG